MDSISSLIERNRELDSSLAAAQWRANRTGNKHTKSELIEKIDRLGIQAESMHEELKSALEKLRDAWTEASREDASDDAFILFLREHGVDALDAGFVARACGFGDIAAERIRQRFPYVIGSNDTDETFDFEDDDTGDTKEYEVSPDRENTFQPMLDVEMAKNKKSEEEVPVGHIAETVLQFRPSAANDVQALLNKDESVQQVNKSISQARAKKAQEDKD